MRRATPLLLLIVWALPAAALETPVANPVRSGTRGLEVPEAAASDGTDTLFIWRSEPSVYSEHFAARVTRDGVTLDRVALPLRRGVEQMVWTGSSYLIIWTEQSAGGRFSIVSLRLDRNGNPIGGGPSGPFRTLKQDAFSVACMANGKNVVIAYTAYTYTIQTRRPQALVLDADGMPVADLLLADADWRMAFDVAWNGTSFTAVWIAENGEAPYDDPYYVVHGIRFGPAGLLDRSPRILFDATARGPQFAKVTLQSDGPSVLLFNHAEGQTFARRVSDDLATLSPPRLLPSWIDLTSYTKAFSTGSGYLLLRAFGAPSVLRLDRDGNVIETKVIEAAPGSTISGTVVAAVNSSDVAVAWSGFAPGFGCADSDLFATVVSTSTLERRFQALVSQGPRDQQSSLVAAGGTNILAAWRSGSAVYTRRFLPDGSPLDAEPLFLAECATLLDISFNGRDYFLFLSVTNGFEIRRVPRDGPLRAEPAATVSGLLIGAVRSKSGTAILWTTSEGAFLSRLSAEGTLLQTGPLGQLGAPDARPRSIAIAAGDDGFLIVWEQPGEALYCTPPTNGSPPSPGYCLNKSLIRGARVSDDLVNRNPFGFDISTLSPFEFNPKVTWNGHAWLVAWRSAGTPRSVDGPVLPEEIRGRIVGRDGTLDGNPAGVLIASNATSPAIEWDGTRYMVSWQRYENVYPPPPRTTRVGWLPDLGRPFLSVQEIAATQDRPVVAATGTGTAVAAYSRPDADVMRAFVNVLEPATSGAKRRPAH